MVTLEQIRLLETKIVKAIAFVEQVSEENARLKAAAETYQKRIDELEVLMQRFKDEQGKIEEGIVSALDRLNQFEAVIEESLLSAEPEESAAPIASAEASLPENQEVLDASMYESPQNPYEPLNFEPITSENESDAAAEEPLASYAAPSGFDPLRGWSEEEAQEESNEDGTDYQDTEESEESYYDSEEPYAEGDESAANSEDTQQSSELDIF